jgi:hypothetical protein
MTARWSVQGAASVSASHTIVPLYAAGLGPEFSQSRGMKSLYLLGLATPGDGLIKVLHSTADRKMCRSAKVLYRAIITV